MMIWSLKRKRNPDGALKKYKARLCYHGGQQQWGVNYWDTYAHVVSWSSVRVLITLAKHHNFHTQSVDFVQAYPQANVKYSIYLCPPAGDVLNDNQGDIRLKDVGRTWFKHLKDVLSLMNFVPTVSNHCIFTNVRTWLSFVLTIVSLFPKWKK